MDTRSLNERIAKALGWDYGVAHDGQFYKWQTHMGTLYHKTPNWAGDLNLMHELENVLTEDEKEKYASELMKLLEIFELADTYEDIFYRPVFTLVHATAEQRARAWLKVKE